MVESKLVKGFREVFDRLERTNRLYLPCPIVGRNCGRETDKCKGGIDYTQCNTYQNLFSGGSFE